ncbi:MAG: HAD family hydrolase [Oscillospiraceae bacterium]|nr:HAD family hydrolase [Oscillospiraceae bacterium]
MDKMNNMKKKAIIFDLDGTLWDAAETIAPAWNTYLRSRGIDRGFTPDDCRSCCGKTLPEIAAMLFPDADPAWREGVVEGCCDAECIPLAKTGGRLYPGLEAILEALHRNYFLAVVSNCGLGYIEAFFSGNHTGHFFDDYENAARTGLSKGENIRLVMERNGIARAVYVGDTEGDHQAALQAGIPFIHAAYGYGQVTGADFILQRVTDLPVILDKASFFSYNNHNIVG